MAASLATLPEDIIEVICKVTFIPEVEIAPSYYSSSSSESFSDESDYGWGDDGEDGDTRDIDDGEESTQSHDDGGDFVEENHENYEDSQEQLWVPDTDSDLGASSDEGGCFNCGRPRNACYREETRYGIDRYCTLVINCREDVVLEKESLCVKDVMNLRLTCRSLSISLIEWFRREFPKCKWAQTGIAEISMTYRGLQDFSRTMMSEIIASNITILHVNIAKLSLLGLRGWRDDCNFVGMCGKLFLEPVDQTGIEAYGNATNALVELEHLKMIEGYVKQEWMMAIHEDAKLLQEAFAHLPNLKEVAIGEYELAYERHNYFYQATPRDGKISRRLGQMNTLGTPDLLVCKKEFGCEAMAAALNSLLQALASHPMPLRKLTVQMAPGKSANEEAGVWALQLPQPTLIKLAPTLAQLKHLHLAISLGSCRHRGPNSRIHRGHSLEGFTKENSLQGLLSLLSAASSLESFNLVAAPNNEFSIGFVRKVLGALPPTIKALHLHNMLLSVPVLAHFFNSHRHSLEEVGLTKVYLTDESWTPVFRMMRLYLPHLQNVYFEQLWELHPAFSDKLFFFPPRRYAGARDGWLGRRHYAVGCAHRGPGRFADGKWIPYCRYDSLVIQEAYKERWMVQGVQDGLHLAIRWGKREAVEYGSTNVDDPLPEKVLDHVCEAFGKTREEYGIPEQCDLVSA